MKYTHSVTFHSKYFTVTARNGKETRTLLVTVKDCEIPYADALELENEFTELTDSALHVKF